MTKAQQSANYEVDALVDRGRLSPSSLPISMKVGLTKIEEAICRRVRTKRPPDRAIEDIRQEENVEEIHRDEEK